MHCHWKRGIAANCCCLLWLLGFLLFILGLYVSAMYSVRPTSFPTDTTAQRCSFSERFVFVHVTDLHLSKARPDRNDRFRRMVSEHVRRVVAPDAVLCTGDIADQKANLFRGEAREIDYVGYDDALRGDGLPNATTWFDVSGNHDTFGQVDRNSSGYRRHAMWGAPADDATHVLSAPIRRGNDTVLLVSFDPTFPRGIRCAARAYSSLSLFPIAVRAAAPHARGTTAPRPTSLPCHPRPGCSSSRRPSDRMHALRHCWPRTTPSRQ